MARKDRVNNSNAISYVPKFPAVPEPALKYHEDALIRLFRVADDHLAHSPYFAGDEITVADLGI
jgi:glutathione S-transferase